MPAEESQDCLYLVRDAFGEQYADAYLAAEPIRVTGSRLPDAVRDVPASMIAVVHSGQDGDLRDALDRLGFERGVPTVGVGLLPTRIVCGPAVIPGSTACHACHRRRVEQHRDPAHADDDPDGAARGLPEGFGRMHLAIAHGLLELAKAEMRAGPEGIGGTVRSHDLVSGGLSTAATVAVDRCARCGDRWSGLRDGAAAVSGLM